MLNKRKNNPFDEYLNYDEDILWMGKPHPWRINTACRDWFGYIFLGFFTLIWNGIMYSLAVSMALQGQYWFLLLPHFWVAVFLFPGNFIMTYLYRRKTYYAVTNQRVLMLNTLWGDTLSTLYLDDLSNLSLTKGSGGYGSIHFHGETEAYKGKRRKAQIVPLTFEHIAEVQRVYRGIHSTRSKIRNLQVEEDDDLYDELYEEQRHLKMKRKHLGKS